MSFTFLYLLNLAQILGSLFIAEDLLGNTHSKANPGIKGIVFPACCLGSCAIRPNDNHHFIVTEDLARLGNVIQSPGASDRCHVYVHHYSPLDA
jgi:hypothetical protein